MTIFIFPNPIQVFFKVTFQCVPKCSPNDHVAFSLTFMSVRWGKQGGVSKYRHYYTDQVHFKYWNSACLQPQNKSLGTLFLFFGWLIICSNILMFVSDCIGTDVVGSILQFVSPFSTSMPFKNIKLHQSICQEMQLNVNTGPNKCQIILLVRMHSFRSTRASMCSFHIYHLKRNVLSSSAHASCLNSER